MVAATAWSRAESAVSVELCRRYLAGGAVFGMRRSGPRLQHQSDPYRFDVQHGFDSHDFLRLHLLSLECSGALSYPSENCPSESVGLRERRAARDARAAVSAPLIAGCIGG